MGEVYQARDRNLTRQVAIKMLPASVAGFERTHRASQRRAGAGNPLWYSDTYRNGFPFSSIHPMDC